MEEAAEPSAGMHYFAYGSNMDPEQMARRCPGAVVVGLAWLPDHRLAFTGRSRTWGGAVATALPEPGEVVVGVLYEVSEEELRELDRSEGHPRVYRRLPRTVVDARGEERRAQVYLRPLEEGHEGQPSRAYLEALRRGYRAFDLDTGPLERWAGKDAP